jgi:hypothetical protein
MNQSCGRKTFIAVLALALTSSAFPLHVKGRLWRFAQTIPNC